MSEKFLYNLVKRHNISKPLFITYFITIFAIIYFSFFTIFGEKGLIELLNLKRQIADKKSEKKELITKSEAKKNMVNGMSMESLDVDLLDEQARKVLGYAGKNEVVIYNDKKEKKDESNK